MGQTHKIKKHRSSPHGKNLSVEDEAEFKRCIEKLREARKSWTEISRMFGDESPLWAKSAYRGRGLAQAADLIRARELVAELPKENGIMATNTRTHKNLTIRFNQICDALLSKPYEYPLFVIAIEFFGLASAGVSGLRNRGGHPSEEAVKRGERMFGMMEKGDWAPIIGKTNRELTQIFKDRKDARIREGMTSEQKKEARAPVEPVERTIGTGGLPPTPAIDAAIREAKRSGEPAKLGIVGGNMVPANPFEGLGEVRTHLMAGAEKLEELMAQVPPSFRAPWETTRDELLTFIAGLDV